MNNNSLFYFTFCILFFDIIDRNHKRVFKINVNLLQLMMKEFDGILFLVVGNSGSGKDTLIRALVERYPSDRKQILTPKRYITRPPSETEDNISITPEDFRKLAHNGKFAFEWHIYGLSYGVPIIIDDWLYSGHPVIINVSREIVREAREKYKNLKVIFIEVPFEVSVKRLKNRKRESRNELKQRIDRARTHQTYEGADFVVDNSGLLKNTVGKLMDYILMNVKESTK
ncbi:MAG: phosphonate metabolism protein/1,5-bisphosphokinase (PRPP-forming) PhnN [Promethearchaeota archaeon]|nr:MAG: phosphonate metabolism protein/1,5-bisphosphokinase (PRPP-forming) PhnN [Candidatus Lokiarchaeota archaeon]